LHAKHRRRSPRRSAGPQLRLAWSQFELEAVGVARFDQQLLGLVGIEGIGFTVLSKAGEEAGSQLTRGTPCP